jgi:hypothetical protein
MPTKTPERKRQWEREHREQRNARRRMQRLSVGMGPFVREPAPDPIPPNEPKAVGKDTTDWLR